MTFDYGSVLLAVGASGAALSFTLFTNWLRQRGSGFLMTWALAMAILVVAVIVFAVFSANGSALTGASACVLLLTALSIHYGGLVQFRDGAFPLAKVALLASVLALPIVPTFAVGADGLGFVLVNLQSAVLVGVCGAGYWRMRAESPAALIAVSILHHALALSFLLCAVVGAIESPIYLSSGAPHNWAEVLNLVASVIALTGSGGLLVTVHQERISRQHKQNALTDPLTGLANRRALFELYENNTMPVNTAVVVLDLDEFKTLNDTYGHAVGDAVLKRFATLLSNLGEPGDMAFRLGGEEFVLVLPNRSINQATAVAERVRAATAKLDIDIDGLIVKCTVSAGLAVAERPGKSFDTILRKADNALYLSKRNGRNRVSNPATQAA